MREKSVDPMDLADESMCDKPMDYVNRVNLKQTVQRIPLKVLQKKGLKFNTDGVD